MVIDPEATMYDPPQEDLPPRGHVEFFESDAFKGERLEQFKARVNRWIQRHGGRVRSVHFTGSNEPVLGQRIKRYYASVVFD